MDGKIRLGVRGAVAGQEETSSELRDRDVPASAEGFQGETEKYLILYQLQKLRRKKSSL